MATALLLSVVAVIIAILDFLLSGLGWQFPVQIVSAYQVALDVFRALQGVLPFIGDMLAIILIVVPARVIRYTFDIAIWLFSMIPIIGRVVGIPKHTSLSSVTVHTNDRGKTTVEKDVEHTTTRSSWFR